MHIDAALARGQCRQQRHRCAAAILQLADQAQPPLRLPLGTDTVARIVAKNQCVAIKLQQWLALAQSTDFEALASTQLF